MPLKSSNRSVMQDWTFNLTFMQQTVLITAVRGPDGVSKYHQSKTIWKWYRRCILLSAFSGSVLPLPYDQGGPLGGSFMGPSISEATWNRISMPEGWMGHSTWQSYMSDCFNQYLNYVDELPHHCHMHLVHAAEILGYKHPDEAIRGWWYLQYDKCADDLHMYREPEAMLDRRLNDGKPAE